MGMYSQESLERLRKKIDVVEVISSYVTLKKSGAHYKACCPFHNEKTPSFVIQKGDSHYHCFGCSAHGDAIAFMMSFLNLSFQEAVEQLADRFQVHLEFSQTSSKNKGPSNSTIKDTLNKFAKIYHFYLLHTDEGQAGLQYLYQRGIDLAFIKNFSIGMAPKDPKIFNDFVKSYRISNELLKQSGLIKSFPNGSFKPFFMQKIMFPIHDTFGNVIGFSGRKYTHHDGPKYINSPETPVFKKSHTLFGIRDCRRRIAKEQKVILVEGQIDALRLIHEGLNFTLASQGTAFGEGHVDEIIHLGVKQAYLCFDADTAGLSAAVKVGQLLQKRGVEVFIPILTKGEDPDTLLMDEGIDSFQKRLSASIQYLTFLVKYYSKSINIQSPAGKNEIVKNITKQIYEWDHPVMIHEALKKLAELCQLPEDVIEKLPPKKTKLPPKKAKQAFTVDPNRVLETDVLTWLILQGSQHPDIVKLAKKNIEAKDFTIQECKDIYMRFFEEYDKNGQVDFVYLANCLENDQEQTILSEIMNKKINSEKPMQGFHASIQKILERNWLEKREKIRKKIHLGGVNEDEILQLAKQFDEIKAKPPKVQSI